MNQNQHNADDSPQSSPPPNQTLVTPRQPTASPRQTTKHELDDAIHGSQEILATASTINPLWPDTITVDRAKFTVTRRRFVASAHVMSMGIEDVLNVTSSLGPIFGNVTVVSRVLNSRPLTIGRFWRKDAMRIKRIAQGYIIALQRGIDCSTLSAEELADKLHDLGEDDHIVRGRERYDSR